MVVGDRKSSQSQKVFIALAAAFFVFYYLPVAATAQLITIKATDASKNQQCDFPNLHMTLHSEKEDVPVGDLYLALVF